MGKRRRGSTPSKKANNSVTEKDKETREKETKSRRRKVSDSDYEKEMRDFVEPEVNVEVEEEKDEVGEARFRFYGALKGLPDKKEDSESDTSLSHDEDHDEEDLFSDSQINIVQDRVRNELARKYQDKDVSSLGFTSSNKFLAGLDTGARDDVIQPGDSSVVTVKQSYVMKLFDRSVDLAQFDDSTPLYPIIRSWVANQPKKPWEKKKEAVTAAVSTWNIKEEVVDSETPISKKEEDEDTREMDTSDIDSSQIELKAIYKLPPPSYYVDVNAPSIRIPKPLPKYIDDENPMLPNESKSLEELPSQEDLLKGHLYRWSLVKTSWKHASQKNEERYAKSRELLHLMYIRSQKRGTQ